MMKSNPSTMLRAKKSLGQNFLKNPEVVKTIIDTALLRKSYAGREQSEVVLEVGPGMGVLTEALIEAGARVIAVEKDERLIAPLKNKFPTAQIIHGDILTFDITTLSSSTGSGQPAYKLVANIPYYITGAILEKFLTAKNQPSRMVLMLQKEVAERIVAKDGKESILSISIKAYGSPSYICTVPRTDFEPAPNVDSAILLIENISREFFTDLNEQKFFEIVKKGFAHKRKKLGNNLELPARLRPRQGRDFGEARAEELSLDDWKKLALEL